MNDLIYQRLNAIAPCFYKMAPREDVILPVISYYYLLAEPMRRGDNTYGKSKRIIASIEAFESSVKAVEELSIRIENEMRDLGGNLRNMEWLTEGKTKGISFEFEFFDIQIDQPEEVI
jgi:hypothetical protein